MKRINPYTRLLTIAKKFVSDVKYRQKKSLFFYSVENLKGGFNLLDLYHHTKAADDLGYNIMLHSDKEGLHVDYIKKIPSIPWELQ